MPDQAESASLPGESAGFLTHPQGGPGASPHEAGRGDGPATQYEPGPDPGESGHDGRDRAPRSAGNNEAPANAVAIALRFAGVIAGQTTIIAALLFYFGWGQLQAELAYFGINASVANLSVDDYLLATPDLIIEVLLPLGVIALVSMAAHRGLRRFGRKHSNYYCWGIGVGAMLCAAGILDYLGFVNYPGQLPYPGRFPVEPVLLAAGIDILTYSAYMRSSLANAKPPEPSRGDARSSEPSAIGSDALRRAQLAVLVALNVVLLFWTAASWSDITGVQYAEYVQSHLSDLTGVSVYSEHPLGLGGVHVTMLQGDNQYPYRYSGLRFLLYSSSQYFLLPDGWKPGRDPVFLLRQGDSIRFEFYGGGRSAL